MGDIKKIDDISDEQLEKMMLEAEQQQLNQQD